MRRILALAAIAAVALLGTTCNPAANDIFPMSVGSVWNMELCLLAGTTLATLDTVQTGTVTNTALEKASLTNGKEVTKFKNESSVTVRVGESTATHDTTTYSYMGEDGDAILSYGSLDDTLGDTVMMSNPSVGQTWTQGSSATATVIGQEDVTVTAGTYKNAWKVKLSSTTGGYTTEMFYWYAKGTGLVAVLYDYTISGFRQVFNQELTSATIK
jgi:hypothetical protein